jgi:predicted component of type VI protein secretion system
MVQALPPAEALALSLPQALAQSLSQVLEQTALPIDLQERKHGIRVAVIGDAELLRTAMFVLALALSFFLPEPKANGPE